MKYFKAGVTETISVLVMWGVITDGWAARASPFEIFFLILLEMAMIEIDIIVGLVNKNIALRKAGEPHYVSLMEKMQDEYYDMQDELVALQKDLAFEQGKREVTDIFMGKLTEKPTFDGAKMINETNGKIVSLDGMSREEKELKAYGLHCDGWQNDEIADELGVSIKSIASYISRGKKVYEKKPDFVQTGDGTWTRSEKPIKKKSAPPVSSEVAPAQ